MILLLLLFNLVSGVENIPKCGETVLDPPRDGLLEKWYPENFKDDYTALIPAHHNCKFKIECPKGWNARVILTVNSTAKHPSVKILDQFGIVDHVFTTSNEHFYFNEKGGMIELNTGNHKTQFGFKVDWVENKKIPIPSAVEYVMAFFQKRDVEYSHDIEVVENKFVPQRFRIVSSSQFVVKAETRVSMNVIASSNKMDKQLLRSVFVYDGPNLEFLCIGTAYQLWKMKSQYVSTGKYMTIQFASRDIENDHWTIFVQDYENTKHIKQFQGVTCKSGHNCGVYEMDATKGPVALQTIYDTNLAEKDVITNLEGKGFLAVHIGGPTKNYLHNRLMYYIGTNNEIFLPQQFIAPLKTYVLHNGTARINITRKSDEFSQTRKFGRQGFISSSWFGDLNNNQQYANEQIFAPEGVLNAKFEYRIKYLWMDKTSTFEVIGSKNGIKIYQKKLNYSISDHKKDEGRGYPTIFEDEFFGDKFAVHFNASGYEGGGVKVDFIVAEP